MEQRLQKIISASGFCSRRAAERLLEEGRVEVNGKTAALGQSASEDDNILIDGKPIPQPPKERTYIMLNKPRGYLCTVEDDRGRKTVTQLTADVGRRIYPVGRLDMDSEGLLILTDDGAFTRAFSHPSGNIKKTYIARVAGSCNEATIRRLCSPMVIDGYRLRPVKVKIIRPVEGGALLAFTLSEGRNRQIRKMCETVGLRVLRLKRISQGGLELGELPIGKWRYLTHDEIEILQKYHVL